MDPLTRRVGIIKDVLLPLENQPLSLADILDVLSSNSSLRRTEIESFVRLSRRFGFVEDTEDERLSITIPGKAFLKYILVNRETEEVEVAKIDDETSVSITLPPFCLPLPPEIKNKISFTSGTMKRVVADAQKELYIVTPFLDVPLIQSCFENVIRKKNSIIRILTSDEYLRRNTATPTGNFSLKELRKLIESRFTAGRVYFMQNGMSIAHAKVFCSDRSLFITSANVKKDSLSENFEAGIYTERKDIINTVRDVIQFIIESGSECILDTKRGTSM